MVPKNIHKTHQQDYGKLREARTVTTIAKASSGESGLASRGKKCSQSKKGREKRTEDMAELGVQGS